MRALHETLQGSKRSAGSASAILAALVALVLAVTIGLRKIRELAIHVTAVIMRPVGVARIFRAVFRRVCTVVDGAPVAGCGHPSAFGG